MTRPPWITEPGWYPDMSDVDYHADPVIGGSMSSTGSRTILRKTPAHFDHERRHGRPDSKELDFGKVAHARVLGRGTKVEVIVGSGKNKNAWATNEDKARVARAKAVGKTPIKLKDHHEIEKMAAVLRAHPTAGPLLARPGLHEVVGVWQDPVTGVWCRFMADFMPEVSAGARMVIVDYKSTTDASPAGFAKSMDRYGYDQQGDWYETGAAALDDREDAPRPQFVLVAQEKDPPYAVSVNYLDDLALGRGHVRNARARETYRRCAEDEMWPGYDTDPVALSLPGWAAREAEAEIDAAEQSAAERGEISA